MFTYYISFIQFNFVRLPQFFLLKVSIIINQEFPIDLFKIFLKDHFHQLIMKRKNFLIFLFNQHCDKKLFLPKGNKEFIIDPNIPGTPKA